MKNKGFTLVELIAVIGILALLLMIAIPTILNARDNSLKALSEKEKRNIVDAGKTLAVDLDDYKSDVYNCQEGSWIESFCQKDDITEHWTKLTLTLDDLINNEYFEDTKSHLDSTMEITIERIYDDEDGTDYKVSIEEKIESGE